MSESVSVQILEIRRAALAEVPAITEIYNQGIADRIATLETRLREIPEMEAWFGNRSERHPVLAAMLNSTVIGWASLNVFNVRECYRNISDVSIYIHRHYRGRGYGEQLLKKVMDTARDLGYRKLILSSLAHNEAGYNLYTKMGFRHVGIYARQGVLDGAFVDMRIMEYFLHCDENPADW